MYTSLIGYLSGGLITIALLPQIIKSWKTKSTKDISIPWMIIYIIGLFLGVVYGFLINSLPIIITTIIEMLMAISLLILKLIYK